jgi:hypothetical protein
MRIIGKVATGCRCADDDNAPAADRVVLIERPAREHRDLDNPEISRDDMVKRRQTLRCLAGN